jgi:putative addiction module killer protein
MIEIRTTPVFERWLSGLRDVKGRVRILARIDRLALGNPGDMKSVGDGILEMRVDTGPGYRIYLTRRADMLVILLCGGDKSSQPRDIKAAKQLAAELED